MSLELTIRRAPRGSAESLCNTCRWRLIQRGFCENEERVFCRYLEPNQEVLFRIRECNKYSEDGANSLLDLEDIATIIEVRSGREVGFQPASKQSTDDSDTPA